MFGMPHDEDSLDREGDDDGGPAAAATIGSIVHRLQRGGPAAVRDLRKFTAALEDLADAYMERDHETFEEAANIARDALNDLIEE
jgi:streptomycin 6-kinase